MFVRRKKNKSGSVSIQVIHKEAGRYQVIQTIGCSSNPKEIESLYQKGKIWIDEQQGLRAFDFTNHQQQIEDVLSSISSHKLVGLELILGKIFDEIGFNKIPDEIFRQLVIFRLAFPYSKLKTATFISRYLGISWSEDQLYRYLDKLYDKQKEKVQSISFEHTKKILNGDISLVFYDVTTLYFEIDKDDQLRKTGFSKDGKHQHPQIVLGLLVSQNGYPLAYEIFPGNKFEGHTMLPVIDGFKSKYGLDKLVVIADSGLLSKKNIDLLIEKGYEFVLGARIKSETQSMKKKILSQNIRNGQVVEIPKNGLRLLVSYSERRANKDKKNRERGMQRLEKSVRTKKLTKAHINNRGYNKYLKMKGEVEIAIDYQKYQNDSQWDGLKGYLTNSKLRPQLLIENYKQLWQIENAFRIAKSEIKIRPIFHRKNRRIQAHICISFAAYKVYKELERQLQLKGSTLTPTKVIEIAENLYEISVKVPNNQSVVKKILLLSEEQKEIAKLFNF